MLLVWDSALIRLLGGTPSGKQPYRPPMMRPVEDDEVMLLLWWYNDRW